MSQQYQVDRYVRVVDELPAASQVGRMWFLVTSTTKKLYATFAANTFTEVASAADSGVVVDAETPTGTINGVNVTFTLAYAPAPAASLKLWVNGILKAVTTEYTLSVLTITMDISATPDTGNTFIASYRY